MDEHDLIYIREGNWNIGQDGIRYDLEPEDVILLQAGHHHYGIDPCVGTVKTWFLHFSREADDRLVTDEILILLNSHPSRYYTVKELADCFGFCDEYYFSKAYKSVFGHAPKSKSRKAFE